MKKGSFFIIICFLFSLAASGCATTGSQANIDNLSNRVHILEDTLRSKDHEINKLEKQINTLSRDISAKDKTIRDLTPAPKPITKTDDHLGVIRVDATVEDVQNALKSTGYYNGNVDGKLGPLTISAIADFQKENGLTSDSVVGKQTWDKLKSYRP
ncbi:MAG: peptidoglycan-binding protein [Candidatus Aceula meridiana]|nr:peptidoglycan-binding protein [Candidatus Aceula meridiana]